jgi:hypothetical protein
MSMLCPAFACAAIALASLSFVSATASCDRHCRPRHPHPPASQPTVLDGAQEPRTEDGGGSSSDAGSASPLFTPQPGDVYL